MVNLDKEMLKMVFDSENILLTKSDLMSKAKMNHLPNALSSFISSLPEGQYLARDLYFMASFPTRFVFRGM